jgi:hypothetical protein
LILFICIAIASKLCNAQKSAVDKPFPSDKKHKNVETIKHNSIEGEETVFSTQKFNSTIEKQLKQDGLLGQFEKLKNFQLTNSLLVVNSKEVKSSVKDKYLSLYFSFMQKSACEACFVAYLIN